VYLVGFLLQALLFQQCGLTTNPLPLLLYIGPWLKLLQEKFITEWHSYKQLQRIFLSVECVLYPSDWSALRSFWHIKTLHLLKVGVAKLFAWANVFILTYVLCIWNFQLMNVISTVLFVMPYTCDGT
jgi:hypothetical protein